MTCRTGPVIVRGERVRGRVECSTVPPGRRRSRRCSVRGDARRVLSVRETFTRWIEAPFSSARRARKILPTLLDIKLPFALEDCVYGFPRLSGAEGGRPGRWRRLPAAERREELEALKSLGADPWGWTTRGWRSGPGLTECPAAPGRNDGAEGHRVAGGRELRSRAGARRRVPQRTRRRLRSCRADQPSAPRAVTGRPAPAEWLWTGPDAESAERVAAPQGATRLRVAGVSVTVRDPRSFLARALVTRAITSGPGGATFESVRSRIRPRSNAPTGGSFRLRRP